MITDSEDLLLVGVAPSDEETGIGGGRLLDVAPVDDPAPQPPERVLPARRRRFVV